MSLLMDALKRAEAQRARGSVPGLNALPTMAVPQDTQRSARTVRWAVSYTHLTPPTSDPVEISVGAVSLKKKNTRVS